MQTKLFTFSRPRKVDDVSHQDEVVSVLKKSLQDDNVSKYDWQKKKTNNFYYPNINDLPNLKVFDSARSKSESYF